MHGKHSEIIKFCNVNVSILKRLFTLPGRKAEDRNYHCTCADRNRKLVYFMVVLTIKGDILGTFGALHV